MRKGKMKYQQPKVYKPTKEEEQEVMENVAQSLQKDKCLVSGIYPELVVQGKL